MVNTIEQDILQVIKNERETNFTNIAKKLNIYITTVSDICRRLESQGKISIRDAFGSKVVKLLW